MRACVRVKNALHAVRRFLQQRLQELAYQTSCAAILFHMHPAPTKGAKVCSNVYACVRACLPVSLSVCLCARIRVRIAPISTSKHAAAGSGSSNSSPAC